MENAAPAELIERGLAQPRARLSQNPMKTEEMRYIPPVTRMVDGQPVVMETIKPEIKKRIEALGKLNDRYNEYKTMGNWSSVLKLSEEYKMLGMIVQAAKIRQEAEEHGESDTDTQPPRAGAQPFARHADRRAGQPDHRRNRDGGGYGARAAASGKRNHRNQRKGISA